MRTSDHTGRACSSDRRRTGRVVVSGRSRRRRSRVRRQGPRAGPGVGAGPRPTAPANNASNPATRGAVGVQAGTYVLNVFDGDHDATYAQRVRRCVFRLSADRRRRVERRQLKPAVAVRGSASVRCRPGRRRARRHGQPNVPRLAPRAGSKTRSPIGSWPCYVGGRAPSRDAPTSPPPASLSLRVRVACGGKPSALRHPAPRHPNRAAPEPARASRNRRRRIS